MHSVDLYSEPQAREVMSRAWQWIAGRLKNGRKVRISLADDKRTLPQNALIHPTIKRLAKTLGRPTDQESLRRLRYLLLEQWRYETQRTPLFERSLDGLRWVEVSTGTSELDKPDCSEFIDWLIAQSSP